MVWRIAQVVLALLGSLLILRAFLGESVAPPWMEFLVGANLLLFDLLWIIFSWKLKKEGI
jgi:hypothetical protein